MTRLAIAMALGPLMGGGGCGSSTTPTLPANAAGECAATVTASSSCAATVPAAAWVFTYPATATQTGAAVQVKLIHRQGNTVTVSGAVSGQALDVPSFWLGENMTEGVVALVETGEADVSADRSIAGTLGGTYQTASGTGCKAVDPQLQLNRCVVTCLGGICICG